MTRRRAWMTAALALMAGLVLWAPAGAGGALSVHVGESTTLTLDYGFKEIAVGNPAVADYMVRTHTPQRSELLINGKQAGVTNLIIWDAQGNKRDEFTIRVSMRDLGAYMSQLKALIGKAEGVRLRIAGEKVVIEGEAVLPSDLPRIAKIVGENNPLVVNMVTLSPLSLKVLAESIQREVGSNTVQVKAVGQKLMISGVVYNKAEGERIEAMARIYYPEVVNILEVRQADLAAGAGEMIQVTAHFMEVNNSVIEGWGVNWMPGSTSTATGTQAIGTGGGFTGSIVGTLTNLFPKFSQAKERGGARILESSSVSVRSGEKADFHSGGEIGIPTPTPAGGTTMTFKQHGVFLNVLPIAQGNKVTMRINVEVSSPTGTSPGGFINFNKSTLSTVQYCTSGDSVALGGLVSHRDTKVFDALPSDSSGALFQIYASEDFRQRKSQLVVFVTPLVLAGGAKDAHQELKGIVEEKFDTYEERKR